MTPEERTTMEKFTSSKDGKLRAAIRIEYRVNGDEIRGAILMGTEGDASLFPTSRAGAMNMVRDMLRNHGDDWNALSWELENRVNTGGIDSHVDKLFPELV